MANDSIVDGEPTKEDHNNIDLEICRRVSRLNRCIRNLDQKMHKLNELGIELEVFSNLGLEHEVDKSIDENGRISREELEVFMAVIQGFKKEEDEVRKRLNELKQGFESADDCSDFDLGISTDSEGLKQEVDKWNRENVRKGLEESEVSIAEIKDFKKEEECMRRRLNELKLGFESADDCSDFDLGISTYSEGLKHEVDKWICENVSQCLEESAIEGIKEFKKEEDGVRKRLNELNLGFDSSDNGSDLSVGISTNIEGLEQKMHQWIYGDEKSNRGNEGFKKEQDDARKKKKGHRDFAQSDSFDCEFSTNINGLKQETYGLINRNEKSKEEFVGSEKEEDGVKRNIIEGKRELGRSNSLDLAVLINNGLERDAYKVMCENEKSKERNGELKKKEDDVKKNLNEPQNNLNRSYEENQALKFLKDQAVEFGIDLSYMLVDLAFLIGDKEQVEVKFQSFKYALGVLKKFIQGEEFQIVKLVQDKIAALPEIVGREMRDTAELKKVKNVSLQCNFRRNPLGMKEIPNKESQIDQFLDRLFGEIIRLEFILSTLGQPKSPFQKKTLSSFESCLKKCEEELKEIALKMNELRNRLEESEKESVGLKLMNDVETEKSKKEEDAKMGLKGLKQNWAALVAAIAAFSVGFYLGHMKKVERG